MPKSNLFHKSIDRGYILHYSNSISTNLLLVTLVDNFRIKYLRCDLTHVPKDIKDFSTSRISISLLFKGIIKFDFVKQVLSVKLYHRCGVIHRHVIVFILVQIVNGTLRYIFRIKYMFIPGQNILPDFLL